MNCHDADVDEAGYLQVIRYKTAKLFEAAAQVGAIIGGASMQPSSRRWPSMAFIWDCLSVD
jgi:geranylgeranyl pyrophosphate synthase